MDQLRVLGAAGVLLITIWLGGILASVATGSDLFTGSGFETATAVSVVALIGGLAAIVAWGRPWSSWKRTAYW